MNTHITILEALVISGLTLVVYALVKTIVETPKSK